MARPRIVIVGAGFAGYQAARTLCRLAGRRPTSCSSTRPTTSCICRCCPRSRPPAAPARHLGVPARHVAGRPADPGRGDRASIWTAPRALPRRRGPRRARRLQPVVLSVGSVNKLLPVPGVAEHAHGFRGIPEALYLRDHMTRQMELADTTDDPAERRPGRTFVVVGAGYTGTEVAAHGVRYTDIMYARHPRLARPSPTMAVARRGRAGPAGARPADVRGRGARAAGARGGDPYQDLRPRSDGGGLRHRFEDGGLGTDLHSALLQRERRDLGQQVGLGHVERPPPWAMTSRQSVGRT